MRLAGEAYARLLDDLRSLQPADWTRATDCAAWDVQAMVAHVVGMTEMSASLPEQRRQMRAAGKAGGVFIDALTAVQVAKHAADSPAQLVERFAVVGPKAAKARRRTPSLVRANTWSSTPTMKRLPERTWASASIKAATPCISSARPVSGSIRSSSACNCPTCR